MTVTLFHRTNYNMDRSRPVHFWSHKSKMRWQLLKWQLLLACLFSPLAISKGWGKSSPSPEKWLVDSVPQSPWKQGEGPINTAKPRCEQQLQEQPYWRGISTAAAGALHKNTALLELPPRPKDPAATAGLLLLLQHRLWGQPWHG